MPNAMSIDVLGFGLDSLLAEQQMIASNIANSDVPGYQAQRVSFESSLAGALASGGTATAQVVPEGLPSGTNGNNVSLPAELSLMERNDLAEQTVVDGLNGQFAMLTTAITG
ncbi:MAG: flagellar basal body protein [Actinomycetota bacterium]|nr:flagellar basal body protein [Actinomycetota bacterium]